MRASVEILRAQLGTLLVAVVAVHHQHVAATRMRRLPCLLIWTCASPKPWARRRADREIMPRVNQAVTVSGRFSDTSVWALGERRFIWLKGCVRSDEQARQIEQLVRGLDDVEGVHLELMTGTAGAAPYRTRH